MGKQRNGGFTLIEIAIVVVIIGFLATAIIGGQALIRGAETQDLLASAKDIGAAVQVFKERYRYLPGDFPVDQTSPEIAGVSTTCRIGGSSAGDGNGRISDTESACASEHLIRAALVRGNPASGLATRFGTIRLIASNDGSAQVGGFPVNVLNMLEMANIPCEIALDISRKTDTGSLQTGTRFRASVANCVAGTSIPFIALAL